ncbi:MAG: type II/IV secretion system ATPase subunit [DPANN group archaeon]|nr:type II/IV secretion system ATPase subunit [DPANN group archaeon]
MATLALFGLLAGLRSKRQQAETASRATEPAQSITEIPAQEVAMPIAEDSRPKQTLAEAHLELEGGGKRVVLPKTFDEVLGKKQDFLGKIKTVHETYPLIKTKWHGKERVLAHADIHFNQIANQLIYHIVEPELTPDLKDLVAKTIEILHDRLEVDFGRLHEKEEIYGYIDEKINEAWEFLSAKPKDDDALNVKYYIYRDTIGLGRIEPIMRDQKIEDISCDGTGVPIFIFHRNPIYGQMPTNVWFESKDELDAFAMKLAQKSGRTVSVAAPLLDAALPDGSRLQITYGTDIARKGSNFSIRKFFKTPLTVIDLMDFQTADPMILAYLWLAIEEGESVLVAGTTAVGKTTFLNAIAEFINPSAKVVSIEDTAELTLMHTNWMPQVARTGFGPKKYGEVTMFDLLKAALRQRPDYIIVGEVRGAEAFVMFQAMATGHASLSTLHADDINSVIDRFTTRPISLPMSLLENLDVIVFLQKTKIEGRLVRKVSQIVEVEGFDRERNQLKTNEVAHWIPSQDVFTTSDSHLMQRIASRHGWTENDIQQELKRRASLLARMQKKGIKGFKEVTQFLNLYAVNPAKLANLMA